MLEHCWEDHRKPVLAKFISILSIAASFDLVNAEYEGFRRETLARIMGKIAELESESEFLLVKKSLFDAAAKFSRGDFSVSALPSFCTAAAAYPPGFKKPEEGEEAKEGEDDEGAVVTGDMFVSLVAKCPIQGECWINSNS